MTRKARGFTLPEILMATLLVGLTLGMGLLVSKAGTEDFTIRGLASQLVADLRFARARAAWGGRPVGLFLPGGAVASQGYALVEADTKSPGTMRVVQAQDWSALGKGSYVLTGRWESLPFATGPVSSGLRTDPVAEAALESWKGLVNGRYLVFSPDGSVHTSDFPRVGGDILLVVAAGCESTGDVLSQVYEEARTVRIRALGGIAQQAGVPGLETTEVSTPPAPSAVGVLPMILKKATTLRAPGNKPPALGPGLLVRPAANPGTLPAGHSAGKTFSVALDGAVSLRIRATDPDGDRLYCRWAAEVVEGVPPGTAPTPRGADETPVPPPVTAGGFSAEGPVPMTWSQAEEAWVSTVEWTPPAGAAEGTWYSLGVVVDDLRKDGRVADWIVVRGISSDQVTWRESQGARHVTWSLNLDGTDPVDLPMTPGVPGASCKAPVAGPDGRKIAFADGGDPSVAGLWIANSDGTDPLRLTPHVPLWLDWSPDGTALAYAHSDGTCGSAGSCVHAVQADGSANRILASPAGRPAWSPDGSRVGFLTPASQGQPNVVKSCKPDGTDVKVATPVSLPTPPPTPYCLWDSPVLWSPDGTRIAAHVPASSTDPSPRLVILRADGSAPSWPVPQTSPFTTLALGWTRDGKVVYARGAESVHTVAPDGTQDQQVTPSNGLLVSSVSLRPGTGALACEVHMPPATLAPVPPEEVLSSAPCYGLLLSSPDLGTWQLIVRRPGLEGEWNCQISHQPFARPSR